jgi:hypothetical protein
MFSLFSTILFWLRVGFNRVKNFLGLPITGYKITDENDRTCNKCQWGPGTTRTANGAGNLCGPGWIHYYEDPLLAILHNPLHAGFCQKTMHLWKCHVQGKFKRDGQRKAGCTKLTTLKRIDVPAFLPEHHIAYSILCGLAVAGNTPRCELWAKKWLDGTDRTVDSAGQAASAALRAGNITNAASLYWAASCASRWVAYDGFIGDSAFAAANAAVAQGNRIDLRRLARKASKKGRITCVPKT